jgi:hypothetical protein
MGVWQAAIFELTPGTENQKQPAIQSVLASEAAKNSPTRARG